MSLKKFIHDNIYDAGDKQPTPPPPVTKKPSAAATPMYDKGDIQYTDSAAPTSVPSGNVSTSDLSIFRKHFADLLAQNNRPGNDYLEFVAAKNAMAALPIESQRYEVAYAGLSAAGLTKQIALESAQFYSGLIDKELNDFQATFDDKFKTEVEDNKANIAVKQKQIVDLGNQIAQLNNDMKALQDKVAESELNLTNKKNSFVKAAQEAKDTIANEVQKINQYIQ